MRTILCKNLKKSISRNLPMFTLIPLKRMGAQGTKPKINREITMKLPIYVTDTVHYSQTILPCQRNALFQLHWLWAEIWYCAITSNRCARKYFSNWMISLMERFRLTDSINLIDLRKRHNLKPKTACSICSK